jgi:hypothetical protein
LAVARLSFCPAPLSPSVDRRSNKGAAGATPLARVKFTEPGCQCVELDLFRLGRALPASGDEYIHQMQTCLQFKIICAFRKTVQTANFHMTIVSYIRR